jgi:hypothetical protein
MGELIAFTHDAILEVAKLEGAGHALGGGAGQDELAFAAVAHHGILGFGQGFEIPHAGLEGPGHMGDGLVLQGGGLPDQLDFLVTFHDLDFVDVFRHVHEFGARQMIHQVLVKIHGMKEGPTRPMVAFSFLETLTASSASYSAVKGRWEIGRAESLLDPATAHCGGKGSPGGVGPTAIRVISSSAGKSGKGVAVPRGKSLNHFYISPMNSSSLRMSSNRSCVRA